MSGAIDALIPVPFVFFSIVLPVSDMLLGTAAADKPRFFFWFMRNGCDVPLISLLISFFYSKRLAGSGETNLSVVFLLFFSPAKLGRSGVFPARSVSYAKMHDRVTAGLGYGRMAPFLLLPQKCGESILFLLHGGLLFLFQFPLYLCAFSGIKGHDAAPAFLFCWSRKDTQATGEEARLVRARLDG